VNGEKKINHYNIDVRCATVYFPVGYQTCSGGHCTTTIERFVGETSCSGSSGSNFIYNSGSGSDGRPSGTPDGGGCSTCEYDPPIIVRPGIINNLKNQPCASDVFKEIKKSKINNDNEKGDFNIVDEVMKIFNESTKYDYIIVNSDDGNSTTGKFNRDTKTTEITVNLNNDYLSRASQLSIARTIIHESLHAYFVYKLQSDQQFFINFELKYSEFRRKRNPNDNRGQHELMGEYVDMMAYGLKSWDAEFGNGKLGKPLLDDDYYKSMAFGGLFKDGTNIPTDSFKALVPSGSDRLKIIEIIQNEQEGINSKGTKCN